MFLMPKQAYCKVCPRQCGAPRGVTRGDGYCAMGLAPKVARAAIHEWEEPCLAGKGGCGAVFFSGCTLHCIYCQNKEISHEGYGKSVRVEDLKEMYKNLKAQGAEALDLVTGTQFLPAIAQSLEEDPGMPVIWNSSGYENVSALKLLEGKVQIYLPDLKYVNADLSRELSDCENYFQVARQAIDEMIRQVGPCRFDEDGRMVSGVLLRHLVLPGYLENTFDVLDYYAEHWQKKGVYISIMAQYTPQKNENQPEELKRFLTQEEYDRVTDYALTLGVENGYLQDLVSQGEPYIPQFDLSGVISTL